MLDTQLKIKVMVCEHLLMCAVVSVLLPAMNPLNVYSIG